LQSAIASICTGDDARRKQQGEIMTDKLSFWEKRLVGLVKKYGRMIEEHRDNETVYFVDGFGQVGGKAPRALIDRKILLPSSDALFEGHSQSYVAL
jgi:hypothetical protein